MKRKSIVLSLSLIITFIFSLSSYAIFCPYCEIKNDDDVKVCEHCSADLSYPIEKVDKLSQAKILFEQEKYDKVIMILKNSYEKDRNYNSDILLAKAYLEKCSILKEEGNLDYKVLVWKPYRIGKNLMQISDHRYFSDALFICANSLFINNNKAKAKRYLKKALKLSSNPSADHLFLLGDIYSAAGNKTSARKTYKKIVSMEVSKNQKSYAYYEIGSILLKDGKRKEGKKAMESALQLTTSDRLAAKIRPILDNLEK